MNEKGIALSETVSVEFDQRRRSHRGMLLAAAGCLLLALAGLLTPLPNIGRAGEAMGDLVHAPLFGGLALGLLCLLGNLWPLNHGRKSLVLRCTFVFACMVTFGVGIELVQHFSGRSSLRCMTRSPTAWAFRRRSLFIARGDSIGIDRIIEE